MDLEDLIRADRQIKENSLKAYIASLRKLNDGKMPVSLDYLKDFEEIFAKIKDLALTTRKNYITAVLVATRAADFKPQSTIDEYRKELDKLNQEYAETMSMNKKTDKQLENWVTISDLRSVVRKYDTDIKDLDLKNKNEIKPKHKELLLNYLVSSLFVLIPPIRLDYSVKIVKKESEIEDKDNYLVNQSKTKKYFIIQTYKNSNKHGTRRIDVPLPISRVINIWLRFNKTNFLLLNNRGGRLSENGLGKLISKAFSPLGKLMTLNLLRKIFVSETIDNEAVKKSQKLADDMLHSTKTQQTIYYKED